MNEDFGFLIDNRNGDGVYSCTSGESMKAADAGALIALEQIIHWGIEAQKLIPNPSIAGVQLDENKVVLFI